MYFFYQDLSNEVQEKQALLDQAKQLADKVKELSNEDPGMTQDITERLESVEKPLEEITDALNKKLNDLQAALLLSQDFKDSMEELNRWLTSALKLYDLLGPVSARYAIIENQENKIEVMCQ